MDTGPQNQTLLFKWVIISELRNQTIITYQESSITILTMESFQYLSIFDLKYHSPRYTSIKKVYYEIGEENTAFESIFVEIIMDQTTKTFITSVKELLLSHLILNELQMTCALDI